MPHPPPLDDWGGKVASGLSMRLMMAWSVSQLVGQPSQSGSICMRATFAQGDISDHKTGTTEVNSNRTYLCEDGLQALWLLEWRDFRTRSSCLSSSVWITQFKGYFVSASIVLVCAVLASLAAGVLIAYGICLSLFALFHSCAKSITNASPLPVAIPTQALEG